MAYVSVNVGNVTGSSVGRYAVDCFSGGINRTEPSYAIEDRQLAAAENFMSVGGALRVRGGIVEKAALAGDFHSILREEYADSRLFHCGSRVYSFDGTALTTLCETIPDEASTFWRMNQNAYLATESGALYQIDKQGNCSSIEPYIPTLMECNGTDAVSDGYTVKEAINMLSRRIKVTFLCGNRTSVTLRLPYEIDTTKEVLFWLGEEPIEYTNRSAEGNRYYYIGDFSGGVDTKLTIEYAVKDDAFEEYRKQIFGCRIAVSFGGSSAGGSRVFLTGNDAYPEQYYYSDLKNPVYFPDTSRETLGDGSEPVVAAEKRYEKLYFFTAHRIFAMSYSFDEQNGAVFTVAEIGTPVGCGMKDSVCLIDNTLVFADRRRGVFLLQSTDIFSELNVRSISGNLSDGTDFAAEGVYSSCDCGRRYYLFNGQKLLVWNYGEIPYYDSGDPSKAARRLCWQEWTGFEGCKRLFSLNERLYFLRLRGQTLYLAAYSPEASADRLLADDTTDTNEGEETATSTSSSTSTENATSTSGTTDEASSDDTPIRASFTAKAYDFGIPHAQKRLCELAFAYSVKGDSATVCVRFSGDEKEFYRCTAELSQASGYLRLRVPPYKAYRYRIAVETVGSTELRAPLFTFVGAGT